MPRLVLYSILTLALLLGLAALWLAREEWESYEQSGAYLSRDGNGAGAPLAEGLLPLQEIFRRLQLPTDSRILEVERKMRNGRLYYEIELLMPEGHVWELYVDPRTAEVLEKEVEEAEEPYETAAGGR